MTFLNRLSKPFAVHSTPQPFTVPLRQLTVRPFQQFVLFYAWRKKMNIEFSGPPSNIVMGNLDDLNKAGGFCEKFFTGTRSRRVISHMIGLTFLEALVRRFAR